MKQKKEFPRMYITEVENINLVIVSNKAIMNTIKKDMRFRYAYISGILTFHGRSHIHSKIYNPICA